jgi:hypothetical protein
MSHCGGRRWLTAQVALPVAQGSILMYLDMQSNTISTTTSSARLARARDGGHANSSAKSEWSTINGLAQDQRLIESPSIVAHFETRWNGAASNLLATLRIDLDISAARGKSRFRGQALRTGTSLIFRTRHVLRVLRVLRARGRSRIRPQLC